MSLVGDFAMSSVDYLRPIVLCRGVGEPGKAACWMSALSQWVGGKWTDTLDCVDVSINRLCIVANDLLSDAGRKRLIQNGEWADGSSVLFSVLGTAGDAEATERRSLYLIDRAIRLWTPLALDAAGLHEEAAKLRSLPGVVDDVTKNNAANAAAKAANAAYAANAAAKAANAAYAAHAAKAAYAAYEAHAAKAANAAYAACASCASNAAARDQFVETQVMPVIWDLIQMGPHTEKEPACAIDVSKFHELCGARS